MPKTPHVFISALFCLVWPLAAATGADQATYDKEQVKQDYRAFLQQLKALNAQYKDITGEIGKVMKEEGTPSWDMGDGSNLLGQGHPKEDAILVPEPGVTIKEAENEMTVTVDMPGIRRDTLKIAVQDGKNLTVSANRKTETETKKVEKSFDLPSAVDAKGAKAVYEDGVLTMKLAKISSKEVLIQVK